MTLLVVGLSHRTAPVTLLDRAAVTAEAVPGLLRDLAASPHVAESMVVTTCNRVEVYADISRFHGALDDVTDVLCKATGVPRDELTPHLFVHYDDRAVAHLFGMASGLDSMVVGESQVLGQVRLALRAAQDAETAGRAVNEAAQAALRVGKRVHSTTGIDRAGQSVVSVALAAAGDLLGTLAGSRVLVLGAGSMSALVLATLGREGVTDVVVANRTLERAEHLAADHGGRAVPLADLPEVLPEADLVVACTGAAGVVLDEALVAGAMAARPERPLVVVDLAMPHDTDPAIADLPGVARLDLEAVAARPGSQASAADVDTARAIVAEEAAAFLAAAAAARVEPVVVSLRARADQVVDVELERLRTRLPGLDEVALAEVQRSVRRAVQALLHTPTVRMKELAAEPDGTRYATALHALFDLDPSAVAALGAAPEPMPPSGRSEQEVPR